MKREDLLEAIGNVDDSILMEIETASVHYRRTYFWKVAAAAAALLLMSVSAFAASRLLSKPVSGGGVLTGTVAPFYMDREGNIVMDPVEGLQVVMDVSFDEDAPKALEEVYRILPSARWEYQYTSVRDDDLVEDNESLTVWLHSERPGQLRLSQYVSGYYGLEGENVVDQLHGLPQDTKVDTQIVSVAGYQVLKVTIPAVKIEGMLEQNNMYCEDGEVRLYWTDGKYLFRLDYPAWMPNLEVEELFGTLFAVKHEEKYPEHWGKLDPQRSEMLSLALDEDKAGTTAVNDTMTVGMMAREGSIFYFANSEGIVKYDSRTGSQVFLETEENSLPRNLFLTDKYVCYTDYLYNRYGLYVIAKDGTKRDYVYEGISIGDLHVTGTKLFGVAGKELKCIDLNSGEIVTIADNVNRYYVDEEYLYILPWEGNYYLRSPRNELVFEKTELSFQPISMVKNGDEVFFTVGGDLEEDQPRYQVIRYSNAVETKLDIYALRMQLLDGKLVYAKDGESSEIWTYDLESGDKELLQENVFDFYVCQDGTVVCHYLYTAGWGILDPETNTLTKIENSR